MPRFPISRILAFAVMGLLMIAPTAAIAVQPDEVLEDPALEERARTLSKDIRCLVCQNQSIDDSNADLARDLRLLVRERLLAGDSDSEIKDYLVDRYGIYVLLTPPFNLGTLLLWSGPFALAVIGASGFFFWFRRQRTAAPGATREKPLSPAEEKRLDELLRRDGSDL